MIRDDLSFRLIFIELPNGLYTFPEPQDKISNTTQSSAGGLDGISYIASPPPKLAAPKNTTHLLHGYFLIKISSDAKSTSLNLLYISGSFHMPNQLEMVQQTLVRNGFVSSGLRGSRFLPAE